jgi:hypothetical protein
VTKKWRTSYRECVTYSVSAGGRYFSQEQGWFYFLRFQFRWPRCSGVWGLSLVICGYNFVLTCWPGSSLKPPCSSSSFPRIPTQMVREPWFWIWNSFDWTVTTRANATKQKASIVLSDRSTKQHLLISIPFISHSLVFSLPHVQIFCPLKLITSYCVKAS